MSMQNPGTASAAGATSVLKLRLPRDMYAQLLILKEGDGRSMNQMVVGVFREYIRRNLTLPIYKVKIDWAHRAYVLLKQRRDGTTGEDICIADAGVIPADMTTNDAVLDMLTRALGVAPLLIA